MGVSYQFLVFGAQKWAKDRGETQNWGSYMIGKMGKKNFLKNFVSGRKFFLIFLQDNF